MLQVEYIAVIKNKGTRMNIPRHLSIFQTIKEVPENFVQNWVEKCIKVEDFMYARDVKPSKPAALVEVGCDLEDDSGNETSTEEDDEEI